MSETLKILIVEDSHDDATLLTRHLNKHGFRAVAERVETAEHMGEALDSEQWDVVLCDHKLPKFDPYSALGVLREKELDIPFIVISGFLPEEELVDLMKAGAHDVIVKSRPARLPEAIRRELGDAETRRKKQQAEVLLQEAIEAVDHGFAVYDPSDRLILANNQYSSLCPRMQDLVVPGVSFEELIREAVRRGVFILDGRETDEFVRDQIKRRKEASEPRELRLTDGRWLRATDHRTKLKQVVTVVVDETKHKSDIAEVERLAQQDPLTKLPNRIKFESVLDGAINQANRTGRLVGVLLLDLDKFKYVNDTFGHAIGDRVLMQTAERLKDCVRVSDTVGRLGGDEFAVVVANTETPEGIAVLAQRIVSRLAEPFKIENRGIFLGTSVGVATFPQDAADAEGLVRKADIAMYRAKGQGRGTYTLYDEDMDRQIRAKQSLETDLHKALARGEIELHYQPRIDLRTLKFVAVEALMRWRHPKRGLVPPDQFIPIAEQTQLILELGDWAIREASRQAKAWEKRGLPRLVISVNVSPMEFKQSSWINNVGGILRETKLAPKRLELEISERGILASGPELISKFSKLKSLGIRRAIHNFGTGYSSLTHMRELPTDTIKIDRSFVQGVDKLWEDTATCATVTRLAHGLRMKVVAEGIERGTQLAAVAEQGCDQGQGFLFAPPMEPDELETFLRDRNGSWSGEQMS